MKIISPKIHAVLDYLVVIFLLASPTIFNMGERSGNFTYALAVIHFLLTILTRFEFGLIKIIPLPLHGIIEFFVAIALVFVSFWFNKNGDTVGYYFYLYFALAILLVFTITDYKRPK
ncbi:hypothetical protein BH11BAC4_BH11BAC4_07720 [soil metagenome]